MRLPVADLIDGDHLLDQMPNARSFQQGCRDLRASVGQRRNANPGILQSCHAGRHIALGIEFGEAVQDMVHRLTLGAAQFLLEQD